mmetsp:Transcript_8465/g.16191  ORF Transcript_8465/g.16191 Transcript_8465/m.16191 type:complete len:306 (-) Transcript_8465:65-982(-)
MIRSSACVAADDVTVRCRVRRSPFSSCTTAPRFDVAMETLCTMRHWHATDTTRKNQQHQEGPELLLAPAPEFLDNRDVTPVRHRAARQRQVSPNRAAAEEQPSYSIALQEILVIERTRNSRCKFTVTTLHQGIFEFDLRNSNHHDLLLAFLQAHLPAERIIVQCVASSDQSTCSSKNSSSQMDVDRLHMKAMQETPETWPARLSRRMSKVVTSIQQLSGTVCDFTACCRDHQDVVLSPHEHHSSSTMTTDVRDEAPLQKAASYTMPMANGGHLEMDEEVSTMTRKDSSSVSVHNHRSPRRPHHVY